MNLPSVGFRTIQLIEQDKTPAKHRDIFRLVKSKSGGGEIRIKNQLIDSN